jgi:outer membrane protein assembly factor BamE
MRIPTLILCAVLAAACVHKIDVEQGNYVTQDLVDQLKPGMTRAEVKGLLGSPLLADIFHANRWDYYFDNSQGRKHLATKRLTVFFKDDKVASWTGDANPPLPPPTNLQASPPPVAPQEAPPAPAAAPPAPATEPPAK